MTIDFLNQVEGDADGNQQAGAAIEAGDVGFDLEQAGDDRGDDRHEGQESRADVGDANHHFFQVLGGPPARPVAGNEGAEILKVFGDLLGIESDRHPEVTEEVNQGDVRQI